MSDGKPTAYLVRAPGGKCPDALYWADAILPEMEEKGWEHIPLYRAEDLPRCAAVEAPKPAEWPLRAEQWRCLTPDSFEAAHPDAWERVDANKGKTAE